MSNMVVEVGLLLTQPIEFYQRIVEKAGATLTFSCETHDLYWSNQDLANMTESEIKKACVRYRRVQELKNISPPTEGTMQNYQIFNPEYANAFLCPEHRLALFEAIFRIAGWRKVFDTRKSDFQYRIGHMKSRIQLQNIERIGWVLYYDNPDLYHLPEKEQRNALIDELNSYGFSFSKDELGIDKLRSLYSGKLCFSMNQADDGNFIN